MDEAAGRGDRDALVAYDQEFHRALFEAGGRPDRARRIVELWESTRRAVPLTYRAWDPLDVAIDAHRPILAAIERRDARSAERLSRAHTRQAAAPRGHALRSRHAGRLIRSVRPARPATRGSAVPTVTHEETVE